MDQNQFSKFFDKIEKDILRGDFRSVQEFLFRRGGRPPSVEQQYRILRFLSGCAELPKSYQINAMIGLIYKMVESDRSHDSDEILQEARRYLRVIDHSFGTSTNLRENRVHLHYSLKTALWHLYLASAEYTQFWKVLEELKDFTASLKDEELVMTFQSTFSHVARTLYFSMAKAVHEDDISDVQRIRNLMVVNIKRASSFLSFSKSVRLQEYLMATAILNLAVNFRKKSFLSVDYSDHFQAIYHVDSMAHMLHKNYLQSLSLGEA